MRVTSSDSQYNIQSKLSGDHNFVHMENLFNHTHNWGSELTHLRSRLLEAIICNSRGDHEYPITTKKKHPSFADVAIFKMKPFLFRKEVYLQFGTTKNVPLLYPRDSVH